LRSSRAALATLFVFERKWIPELPDDRAVRSMLVVGRSPTSESVSNLSQRNTVQRSQFAIHAKGGRIIQKSRGLAIQRGSKIVRNPARLG
jgi:hypothetical protein